MMLNAYNKRTHIANANTTLHLPSVRNKFIIKDNIVQNKQDSGKIFEGLVVPNSLVITSELTHKPFKDMQVENETYSLLQKDFFWKGMCKDIAKCIQNCYRVDNTTSKNTPITTSILRYPKD